MDISDAHYQINCRRNEQGCEKNHLGIKLTREEQLMKFCLVEIRLNKKYPKQ